MIEPVGVVARQSTNVLAVEEPRVRAAMDLISNHACNGIRVQDILDAVGISRSGLEKRFKTTLGYTICKAVRQVQIERARLLILETTLPIKQVADRTGFRSVQHMTTVFAKAFGQPPATYRKRTHR